MQDDHLTTRFFFATFCLSQWDTDIPMLFVKYMASWPFVRPFGFFHSRHSTRPHLSSTYLTQIQLYLIFLDGHDYQSGISCPAAYDEQIDCSTAHAVGAESEEDRAATGLDPSFG
jgi:hypothetical protein